jgi:hypothetical protein
VTRIALAQINPTVGAVPGNSDKVAARLQEAKRAGAALMVTPERCRLPEDLFSHHGRRRRGARAWPTPHAASTFSSAIQSIPAACCSTPQPARRPENRELPQALPPIPDLRRSIGVTRRSSSKSAASASRRS